MKNELFKSVVAQFPTGVTVISLSYKNTLRAFTANSFTAVSLNPGLISFCLNKASTSLALFKDTPYFAVSILSSNQRDVSIHFASNILNKFEFFQYTIGKYSNAPLINGSIAFIECKKYNQFECGDHFIFIGEVRNTFIDHSKSPLIYFAKSYSELK